MPTFRITSPEGRTYRITAPEGATKEQAMEKLKQQLAAKKSEPDELSAIETIQGAGQSLLSGQLLGGADEFTGGARLLLDKLLPETEADRLAREHSAGRPQSDMERYEMHRDDAREVRDQFQDENPVTAFGLEMVGGIASPINLLAPGSGTRGHFARRLAETTGRGAGEGALVGFMEGDGSLEERMAAAKTAMKWGAGLSAGMGTGGRLLGKAFAHRNVKPDLIDADGKFTPIHMADKKGIVGDVYRNTLGRAWGGHQTLKGQEKPFMDAAQESVDVASARAKEEAARLALVAKSIRQDAIEGKHAVGKAESLKRVALRENRELLEREAGQVLDADNALLRREMGQEAMPESHRVSRADVDDPIAVNKKLKEFWSGDEAFGMVKKNQFEWDQGLVAELERAIQEDPELLLALSNEPGFIRAIEKQFGMDASLRAFAKGAAGEKELMDLAHRISSGVSIRGDALMALRNQFAKRANKGGDNAWALRQVTKRFDRMIMKQLGGEKSKAGKAFKEHLNRYNDYLTFRESVTKAADPMGRFTSTEARKAASKYGAWGEGTAPSQGRITGSVQRKQAALEKMKADKASRQKQGPALTDESREARRQLDIKRDRLLEELDQKGINEMNNAMLRAAKATRSDITSLATPENPSGLSAMLTTLMLGSPFALMTGGPAGALLGGYGLAKGLTSKRGQLLIAGQTEIQKSLNKALSAGDTELARQLALANRMLSRQIARMKGDEDE
jgi:hypothetical protein